jgi:hypothetical protein
MSVSFLQVQTAIAALAVPGLKRIYTSANVPAEMFSRFCPALIPHPDTPLLESTSTRLTLGGVGLAGFQRPRTLAYVCLTTEWGEARGAYTHGARTSAVWDALENALSDFALEGLHNVGPVQLAARAPVNDHSGKYFFGFDVRLTFLTSY